MEENESPQTGINRRQLLKRSAIVGGALVWATPVVQSLGGTALASTTSPGGALAPSWTAIVLDCGEGGYTLYKFDQSGNQSCGSSTGLVDGTSASKMDGVCKLDKQLTTYNITVAVDLYGSCSGTLPGVTVDSTGLHVPIPSGCSIIAWAVHDGAGNGCGDVCFAGGEAPLGDDWLQGYTPTVPASAGTATFPKPSVTSCPDPYYCKPA